MTPDHETGKNLHSKPKNGQDKQEKVLEHEPATFYEHKRDGISSSGPRLSNESSRNQNGSGNSLKQQISHNATKSKDSEVVNETNSLKQQISFSTEESKDSNETNESTKNNEKHSRLTLDYGTNMSSRPSNGEDEQETPKIRKSTRSGRGRKECQLACSGCTTFDHNTPNLNLPKKDRKPTKKTSERYIKKSFLKILNSVTQSPRTDNISVSYSPDTKVQMKRKFEVFEGSAKNEASDEASEADPDSNTKNNLKLEDKSQGQSKSLNNKRKKITPHPKIP